MIIRQLKKISLQKGSVLVEMTLVLVFFVIPMLMSIVEFGRIFYTYQKIVHQLHNTARVLSIHAPGVNHEKAKCFFLIEQFNNDCLVKDYSFNGIKINNLKITSSQIPVVNQNKVNLNVVTVSVENFEYDFLFYYLLEINKIKFSTISVSYRQIN